MKEFHGPKRQRGFFEAVSAALGINSLLGDPLGLNSGQDAANAAATSAGQASADAQKQQAQIAADQWNYYKTNYQPLETSLIKQATEAGSPEEFARARGAANADVTGAFDMARKNTTRSLEGMGINPASPAYQSAVASGNLAEAATKAGALTMADRNTRSLAYSKGLDVVGLGRNIPAQSAASAANAAQTANQAAGVQTQIGNSQFLQGVQNTRALGYGLNSIIPAAQKWFGRAPSYSGAVISPEASDSAQFGIGYASGGPVIDSEKTGDGRFDATKSVMMRHGLPERVAHMQSKGAMDRHEKRYNTPHMKVFASGGGVGRNGLGDDDIGLPNDVSGYNNTIAGPGSETSDSIPAQIDGQHPAALSSGEFVMSAPVLDMTAEEVLKAINEAGLKRRRMHGLGEVDSSSTSDDAGMMAYRSGGIVNRDHCGLPI